MRKEWEIEEKRKENRGFEKEQKIFLKNFQKFKISKETHPV